MSSFETTADAFLEMAHRIVWCNAASVDASGRPRSRVVHPIWERTRDGLVGWFGTNATKTKRDHLDASPYLSMNYWDPTQDTCVAECAASFCFDLETRERIWNLFLSSDPPLGYDPKIIEGWDSAESEAFTVVRLVPWRLRVFPGTMLMGQGGEIHVWQDDAA